MYFRKGSIKFKDRLIDNEAVSNGVYLVGVSIPTSPKYNYSTIMIHSTDTTIFTTAGLQPRSIEAEFAIYARNRQEKRQKINALLKGWHGNTTGQLILGDDKDVYYEARILDEIQEKEEEGYTSVIVPFIASPLKYSLIEQTDTMAANTVNQIIAYKGDYKALPIVEFTGTGTVRVTLRDKTFSLVLANETIIVDCQNLIVRSPGYANKIDKFSGDFLELLEGNNTINFTGNAQITTKFKYRNTYLTGGSYA